ncbi:hypothetical protein F5146DRAFT_412323 [Armillaria mellea]|nr:hypothetical protein F5146DRAFT_412323 [Armillaria mellea]
MEPQTFVQPSTMSSLTEWSYRHIRDVFEAPTLEESLCAISNTFAPNVEAFLNGSRLGYEGIIQLVTAMRGGSRKGLQVHWKQAMDVPREPTNRNGCFGGAYVISGIQKPQPGTSRLSDFERHKTVTVIIESQSSDPYVDSRRIVNLVFVATDRPVDRACL